MPPSPRPSVSLFDIFIGSGRTIRKASGPPGTHWGGKPSPSRAVAVAPADTPPPTSNDKNGSPSGSGKGKEAEAKSSDDAKGEAKTNDDDTDAVNLKKTEGEEKKGKVGGEGGGDAVAMQFTAEEDVKLMEMKIENGATWKQIAEEMGRPKWLVMQRFKAVKAEGGVGGGVEEKEKNKEKKKSEGEKPSEPPIVVETRLPEKQKKPRRASKERQHRHHHHQKSHPTAPSKTSTTSKFSKISTSSSITQAKSQSHFSINPTQTLDEDEEFSFGELGAISEIIDRDLRGLWERVSAGFFDVSGRRISPEVIGEKFGGLG